MFFGRTVGLKLLGILAEVLQGHSGLQRGLARTGMGGFDCGADLFELVLKHRPHVLHLRVQDRPDLTHIVGLLLRLQILLSWRRGVFARALLCLKRLGFGLRCHI